MSVELIIVLALLLLFIVGFMFLEPMLSKHKVDNKNEYGSARFSTFNEIKQNFKEESTDNIKDTGVPIWYSKDCKTIWFDREERKNDACTKDTACGNADVGHMVHM